jgi:hypothetical protein
MKRKGSTYRTSKGTADAVAICRWPDCHEDAVTKIGTTLLGRFQLCRLHRAAWLELTYYQQRGAVEHFQPYQFRKAGGAGMYAPMNGADTVGVRRGGGSVVG